MVIGGCSQSHRGSTAASNGGAADAQTKNVLSAKAAAGPNVRSTGGSAGGGAAEQAAPVDLTDPRALIRTADLSVQVTRGKSVSAQADRAGQIAVAAGGDVFADNRTAGTNPSASLTLKVPPDQLTRVLGQLAGLGKEQSRQLSTRDVTTQVADVDARVASARASIARLRGLYDRATKVGEIIAIEQELAQRQANLESLEAQQRTLAEQTSLATVNLSLTTAPAPPAKKHHDDRGFVAGLRTGWDHFTAAGAWLATAFGALLPFLALIALAAAVTVVIRRRPRAVEPPPASTG
jgi:hypothetical protein